MSIHPAYSPLAVSFHPACFLQASTQRGLEIIHQEPVLPHQGQAIIPQGQGSSQQELALTHRVQASITRGLAISRLAQAQNTQPAPATHQVLACRQVQATFRLVQGRSTLPALVAHQFLARRQVQATFRLAQGPRPLPALVTRQLTPTARVASLQARAPAASHLELLSILPDQAISLLAAGLQGVAAVTEQACIQQGRARQPLLVQGGPSTQGRVQ